MRPCATGAAEAITQSSTAASRRSAATDVYTIIYTSGTTGNPKGVVLTHGNAMSVGEMVAELDFISPGERTYLFLPLAHAFALTTQLASFELGTTIIYYGGDTKRVIEELVETHPTYLPSVPRIFEKLYTAAMKLQEQASDEDQARFREAVKLGVEVHQRRQRGEDVPEDMQSAFDAADERLFRRGAGARGLGDDRDHGGRNRRHTGALQVRHRRAPDAGRGAKIAESDGEIPLTGPNIFREYWDNAEASAETLVDGWLHTGDVGEIDDEGNLRITGRKKDIIITAGGKNLTPGQSRERPQAVSLHQPGGHVRRPPPLSGRADHPRSRGDRPLGQGTRAVRGCR